MVKEPVLHLSATAISSITAAYYNAFCQSNSDLIGTNFITCFFAAVTEYSSRRGSSDCGVGYYIVCVTYYLSFRAFVTGSSGNCRLCHNNT